MLVEMESQIIGTKEKLKISYRRLVTTRLPILKWLPRYTLTTLFQDILAGLTVALTQIPQSIAYAEVAEAKLFFVCILLCALIEFSWQAGRCLDSSRISSCSPKCTSDSNCPGAQICCTNICRTQSCTDVNQYLNPDKSSSSSNNRLPLQYGLYSSIMGGLVYVIFGSCKDINIGPTSIMAIIVQPYVLAMGGDVTILVTFLSGIIIAVLGLLRLGFLVDFCSYPIIAGFICATTLRNASIQVKNILGISGKPVDFFNTWEIIFKNLKETRKWDAVLGSTSVICLVALKEIRVFGNLQYRPDWSKIRNTFGRFIFLLSLARNALIVVVGTSIAYCYRNSEIPPLKITGTIGDTFPNIDLPPFSTTVNGTFHDFGDMLKRIGGFSFFISFISILETIAIAKAFAHGKNINVTQEIIALGLCNIAGSFVSSMPVSGSFTRTAVNNASGVRTPLAGVFTTLIILLAIGFLTSSFYYVPKASLGAVIICAMFYLFDFGAFVLLWRTKKLDLIPFLTTFFCCLFLNLEYGILIGMATNLLFILYSSARPKLKITKKIMTNNHQGDIYVITPKDKLKFPAAEYLRDTVLACEEGRNVTIVLSGRYVGNIDVTVAKIIAVVAEELAIKNQRLILVDFKPAVMEVCLGVSKKLVDNFRNGDLDSILHTIE